MVTQKTVTIDYEGGQLTVTGYYTRAYAGTSQTPPEPSLFEVTDAIYTKDGKAIDIGNVPRGLLADDAWEYLGELACRAVEELEYNARMAHAERKE